MSLLLWRANVSKTGDEVMPAAPATEVRLTKTSGGDRVMRVFVSERTRLSHTGQEGGLHEVKNQNVR